MYSHDPQRNLDSEASVAGEQSLLFYQLKNSNHNLINYCYLVINEKNKSAIAIDPAWEPDKFDHIVRYHKIEKTSVLLTHHHRDHIDLADFFASHYNSDVYMSEAEILYYGYRCKNLIPIKTESPLILGAIRVIPIFTPGHTIGSTCYLINKNLYTGDTLFIEGCGICTGKGGDPAAMFKSLNRLKKLISLDDKVYPGHRYRAELGQKFAYLLQSNLYLQFANQEHFIKFRMREGQTGLFNFK